MTAYPNPPAGYYPNPGGRPGTVTTVSVLAIIFGALILLCGGWTLLASMINMTPNNPAAAEMRNDATLMAINVVSGLLYLLLGFFALFGGILSLSLKPAGRTMLNAFSIISIVLFVGVAVVQVTYVGPMTKKLVVEAIKKEEARTGQRMPFSAEGLIGASQIIGLALGGLFMVGLPIVFLALLSRPHVVEAYRRGLPTAPGGAGYYAG